MPMKFLCSILVVKPARKALVKLLLERIYRRLIWRSQLQLQIVSVPKLR